MGIGPFRGVRSHVRNEGRSLYSNRSAPLPNPDPENFSLSRVEEVAPYLAAFVLYPGCTNFEGRKVIVFKGMTERMLRDKKSLDPHFDENGPIIARFKPDEEGWGNAMSFMRMLVNKSVS